MEVDQGPNWGSSAKEKKVVMYYEYLFTSLIKCFCSIIFIVIIYFMNTYA
jgi:hypothetical protein